VFVVGSLLCATATSMPQLAAYRAVQGLGAGGLFSLSVTIVGDLVPPRQRARYTGYLIAVYAVFGVLGPVAGGFFAKTDTLLGVTGWRWVFLVNVPVGLVALAVVAVALRLPRRRGTRRVDVAGAVTLAIGLVPLLAVADEGRSWGWTSPASLACCVVGAIGLVLFVLAERRAGDAALLPLRLFRTSAFRLGTLASVVVGFGMFGALTLLPLYLQLVHGASPGEAGLLMLPLVVGIMATTAVSGKVIAVSGRYRVWPVLGSVVMVLGFLCLATMTATTPFWVTAISMTVFGVGLGANLQSLTLAVQNALPQSEVGVATAAATFTRQLGGSLGAAVFLSILFGTVGDRVTDAFRRAASSPTFRATLADPRVLADPADRALARGLSTGAGPGDAVLDDSSFLARLHPVLARPFLEGLSDAMAWAFLAGALAMTVAVAATLFMPEHPLRGEHDGGAR
jgi:EmrB/QacA subfamily drug resistance transporter